MKTLTRRAALASLALLALLAPSVVRAEDFAETDPGHSLIAVGALSTRSFWNYGSGKGSKLHWDYGSGKGSKLHWDYGSGEGSKLHWDYGSGKGSKLHWGYGSGLALLGATGKTPRYLRSAKYGKRAGGRFN